MKEEEILAALAVGHQKIADRQETIEEVFKESIIIPGAKINSILLCSVLSIALLCITFCFVWYFGG